MPDPLTPEQMEFMRSLPRPFSEVRDDPCGLSLYAMGLVAREGQRGERVLRTHFGDILLATIDTETAALKARIAELEAERGNPFLHPDDGGVREPTTSGEGKG